MISQRHCRLTVTRSHVGKLQETDGKVNQKKTSERKSDVGQKD